MCQRLLPPAGGQPGRERCLVAGEVGGVLEVRRAQPSHLEDAKRPFRVYGLPEMRSRGQCEQLILEVQAAAQHRDGLERFEGRPGQGRHGHVPEGQQNPPVLANHADPAPVVALGHPAPVHDPQKHIHHEVKW